MKTSWADWAAFFEQKNKGCLCMLAARVDLYIYRYNPRAGVFFFVSHCFVSYGVVLLCVLRVFLIYVRYRPPGGVKGSGGSCVSLAYSGTWNVSN